MTAARSGSGLGSGDGSGDGSGYGYGSGSGYGYGSGSGSGSGDGYGSVTVNTRRMGEARTPRLVLRAPGSMTVWAMRALVSRFQAAIESASDAIRDGAPWEIVRAYGWPGSRDVREVSLELHTFAGTDAEADLGVALLERVRAEWARAVAA